MENFSEEKAIRECGIYVNKQMSQWYKNFYIPFCLGLLCIVAIIFCSKSIDSLKVRIFLLVLILTCYSIKLFVQRNLNQTTLNNNVL